MRKDVDTSESVSPEVIAMIEAYTAKHYPDYVRDFTSEAGEIRYRHKKSVFTDSLLFIVDSVSISVYKKVDAFSPV